MKKSVIGRRYGWKKQLPDIRDFKFSAKPHILAALPPAVDLRPDCPPVYDQGSLGSCTANAIGSAHQFGQIKQKYADNFIPSRLFIYWNERSMEGTVNDDSGAMIRDGMKTVAKEGVCPETMWSYNTNEFKTEPSPACYANAKDHQVLTYNAVPQSLDQMRACLAEGFPFVFGFTVYENFESKAVSQTGIMPMPGGSVMGGHAVKAVGYDDAKRWFVVKNSWGTSWGDKGYFYMPYSYIANANLASDFWTIRMVEDEDVPTPTPTPPDPTPTPTPPKPEPSHWPCDWSLAFPATKAFVDGAVGKIDEVQKANATNPSIEHMIEGGLRGLQQYLKRVEVVRNRKE